MNAVITRLQHFFLSLVCVFSHSTTITFIPLLTHTKTPKKTLYLTFLSPYAEKFLQVLLVPFPILAVFSRHVDMTISTLQKPWFRKSHQNTPIRSLEWLTVTFLSDFQKASSHSPYRFKKTVFSPVPNVLYVFTFYHWIRIWGRQEDGGSMKVRFKVLTAVSMKMADFCVVAMDSVRRQQTPLKRLKTFAGLNGATTRKTAIFMLAAMTT
jgi:hypothetical protein